MRNINVRLINILVGMIIALSIIKIGDYRFIVEFYNSVNHINNPLSTRYVYHYCFYFMFFLLYISTITLFIVNKLEFKNKIKLITINLIINFVCSSLFVFYATLFFSIPNRMLILIGYCILLSIYLLIFTYKNDLVIRNIDKIKLFFVYLFISLITYLHLFLDITIDEGDVCKYYQLYLDLQISFLIYPYIILIAICLIIALASLYSNTVKIIYNYLIRLIIILTIIISIGTGVPYLYFESIQYLNLIVIGYTIVLIVLIISDRMISRIKKIK